MSTPTFERFNYALRPAKNIERKMICEGLGRLSRIARLSEYKYIGFGAIGFVDFTLFHQRMGIDNMLSIECEVDAKRRVKFNRPFSCIDVEWGWSHDILPYLHWVKRCIVWLDYDGPINQNVLSDISTITSSVPSGSAFILTVNADPGPADAGAQEQDSRLEKLKARVGVNRLPANLKGSDLAQWGYAGVLRGIIDAEIKSVVYKRNSAKPKARTVTYHQLFNFRYQDGNKMLTVGGVFLNPAHEERLKIADFDDLEFIRSGAEPYTIDTPVLTLRELRHLDERLPSRRVAGPSWLPRADREMYWRTYRYFPSFSEMETHS